eukprot:TRINITY_DN11813_c0_g1_i7.p2 TRINITY_DN11813_c0_g1~~TRINITY_DN11813_c0_g1_i7.p2  ORF type:complete len:257 (-),score=53.67 TRINITY_DN11813_c0_g1_i7:1255-2025(-)
MFVKVRDHAKSVEILLIQLGHLETNLLTKLIEIEQSNPEGKAALEHQYKLLKQFYGILDESCKEIEITENQRLADINTLAFKFNKGNQMLELYESVCSQILMHQLTASQSRLNTDVSASSPATAKPGTNLKLLEEAVSPVKNPSNLPSIIEHDPSLEVDLKGKETDPDLLRNQKTFEELAKLNLDASNLISQGKSAASLADALSPTSSGNQVGAATRLRSLMTTTRSLSIGRGARNLGSIPDLHLETLHEKAPTSL